MGVQPSPADHAPVQSQSPQLPYGTTAVARTSVLAWVGLGFTLLGAFVAAPQVMIVASQAGTRMRWIGPAHHLLLPLLAILLAAFGWRRHAKRWPAVAVAIAVLSILTLLLLGSRTFGPLPRGESPWHWPRFEWTG